MEAAGGPGDVPRSRTGGADTARRSITTRLVAMFTLAALLVFLLVGLVLHRVVDRELKRHEDDALAGHLQNMTWSIERYGDAARWDRSRAKMDTLTPDDGRIRFWVLSDDPRFQYGRGVGAFERFSQDADGRGEIRLAPDGPTYRTLARWMAPLGDRPAVRLVVGVDTSPYDHTLRAFAIAFATASAVALALVAVLGRWIAGVGLAPLQLLSTEAKALRPKSASQRLRTAHLPVELADLSEAFNGALARLEGAYRQLEAFNADVAHELRTPLANLIGGTQVALSRPREAGEFRETLESNLEELERLRSIVNDMLFLARADQGEAATGRREQTIVDEVRKTIEFFEPVLDETGTQVAVDGELDALATIDAPLFRRALSNLLQNALDHAAPGERLVVRLTREPGAVWIRVSNPGPTIAPAHLPRLFDRFYRVDAARHDEGARHGHGLGLAIVKAVATMHGGGVAAESGDGVTTIGFSVPAV